MDKADEMQKRKLVNCNLRSVSVELMVEDLREIDSVVSTIRVEGDRSPEEFMGLSGRWFCASSSSNPKSHILFTVGDLHCPQIS